MLEGRAQIIFASHLLSSGLTTAKALTLSRKASKSWPKPSQTSTRGQPTYLPRKNGEDHATVTSNQKVEPGHWGHSKQNVLLTCLLLQKPGDPRIAYHPVAMNSAKSLRCLILVAEDMVSIVTGISLPEQKQRSPFRWQLGASRPRLDSTIS